MINTNWHQLESLTGLQQAQTLGERLVYFLYFVLGTALSFSALYTLLKTISYVGMDIPLYVFAVAIAFILVQGVLGYGLLYMRKWLLPIGILVFTVDFVALIVLGGTILFFDTATLMRMALSTLQVLLFYFTRSKLVGDYMNPVPLVLYTLGFIVAAIYSLSYMYGVAGLTELI